MPKSREIHLVQRPTGAPKPEDFTMVEREVADATEGQVLVRNLLMSVDPAMRPRLTAGQATGEAMMGGAHLAAGWCGPKLDGLAVGELVTNRLGFRDYFSSEAKGLTKLSPDPELPLTSPAAHALRRHRTSTAYGGLLHIGQLMDGELVFVSTAAGAVGSVAAQIAKIKGCYVVGSTGSDEKAA